jgi:hypothetical protein
VARVSDHGELGLVGETQKREEWQHQKSGDRPCSTKRAGHSTHDGDGEDGRRQRRTEMTESRVSWAFRWAT